MKKLFTYFLLLLSLNASATNRYFSNSGNDNTGNGTIGLPYATIAKFNLIFSTFSPGDSILFQRNGIFYGAMIISRSGSIGLPIVIGAYGSGNKPVITGFVNIDSWVSAGTNLWDGTSADSSLSITLSSCNMVTIGGVNTAMGRYPNSGYITYQSASTNVSVTASGLNSATTNWTGADLFMKNANFAASRNLITSHVGTTISYTATSTEIGRAGFGCFIENDVRTLDAPNEWYYNPTTKKIRIFSTSSPTNVKVATLDSLVYMPGRSYITIDGISFTGSNSHTIYISETPGTQIKNCSIDFSGLYAIWGGNNFGGASTDLIITGNTINHTNSQAIVLQNHFSNAYVAYNTITNSGKLPGMVKKVGSQFLGAYGAIWVIVNDGFHAEYNRVDSSGYASILWTGNNTTINNNHCSNDGLNLQDGGSLYTIGTTTSTKIYSNIVHDGWGDSTGTPNASGVRVWHGIYLDDNGSNDQAYNNSVFNYPYSGIFNHSTHNSYIHHNTVYNCGLYQAYFQYGTTAIRSDTVKSNIFFAKTSTQKTAGFASAVNDIASFFTTSDSNYYARPIGSNITIETVINNFSIYTQRTLAGWKTYSGFDANSNESPITITDTSKLKFYYNATVSPVVQPLPSGTWIDVRNVPYNTGSVTLQPYTSIILINTGTNVAPTANAGIDQTIQLPTSSVNLVGSGSDTDGSIASYAWTKVSGTGGTITNPSAASTSITGLTAGVYQFKLTVTDNGGLTGTDQVQITVNPANIPPTANAGTDQAIQLPTSTTTLVGSGNDPDGSITAYLWTKVSGPAGGTITSSTAATTGITALGTGTYVFNLRVTDNQGATGNDQISVIVSASPNVAPTANAGVDQNIQLPTSSVNLSGSGNDPDGSITAYAWTKVSVPAGDVSVVTSPSSASSTFTGLTVTGVYQLKLTVIDNGTPGLTGTDLINITVIAANQPPVVNAGIDQTIASPTSSVTLSGSASDPDGSVSSHTWTKISGTGSTITSASSYSTTVTGLSVGTYVFRLTATDNQSLTGFDEMNVIVNVAPNIPPTANAGVDQVVTYTYPTNTVTLSGSGSDPDGTISSGVWSKVSGASVSITTPNNTMTTVTGLVAGIYKFQLLVTDNSGGQGRDTVQITVNPKPVTLAYTVLSKVYTGSPLSPTVTATPSDAGALLTLGTSYNGTGVVPTNVGSYTVISGISDPNYTASSITNTFTITKATATFTISNLSQVYNGSTHPITVTTTPAGLSGVSILYNGSATAPTTAGSYTSVVISLSNSNYQATPVTVTLTIAKATPTVSWATPTAITYGTALSGTQLSATATGVSGSLVGVFDYTPPSGTILNAGAGQVLSVNFTPTDATNYNSVTNRTVLITVNKATATISLSNLTQTFDGNPKPVTVTTNPVGLGVITTTYNGSTTAPSAVGTYPVISSLVNSNYTATPATGNLVISTSAASIFITNLNQTYTGSPRPVTVTTNPAGLSYSITYNGSATVPTNAGSYTVIATINDGIHTGTDTQTLTIAKATPVVSWANPAAITYPAPLSGTQLNASASVAGSFVYTPPSGTVLSVGTQSLLATFTPTDGSNYNGATKIVSITVNASTVATLTLSNLAQVYDGTPKPVIVTSNPSGLSGITVTYNGSSSVPTNAGSYAIIASLVNANYTATPVNGTLVIAKGSYTLAWTTPQKVKKGTALTAGMLNATSTIAGTFSYNYAVGFILNKATTITATFTPTDLVNYPVGSISVTIQVQNGKFNNAVLINNIVIVNKL